MAEHEQGDAGKTTRSADYPLEHQGVLSAAEVFGRLSVARDAASSQSNKFAIAALVFCGLALVKISELDIGPTLFGINTSELKYGLFLFIIAGQIAAIISTLRTMDARAYEHNIGFLARRLWPDSFKAALHTFPNVHEWLIPSNDAVEKQSGHAIGKFVYKFCLTITAMLAFGVIILPIALGAYYLSNWQKIIVTGNVDIQFWAVATMTGLSALWCSTYIILHTMTELE